MTPTKRGDALAWSLVGHVDPRHAGIRETCALIARHAQTYNALREQDCNIGLTDAEQAKSDKLEARIAELVRDLPETDGGPFTVRFSGDPRGYTVRLVSPVRLHGFGTWASEYELGIA